VAAKRNVHINIEKNTCFLLLFIGYSLMILSPGVVVLLFTRLLVIA